MRKNRLSKLTLAALALLALVGTTAAKCAPAVAPGPANVNCSVKADYPHQSTGTPTAIDGKVRVTCRGATIESLTIEAKLQRLDHGVWTDIATTSQPAPYAPAINGKQYTKQANFPCSDINPGDKFRTAGRASGVFGGNPAGSKTWTYNPKSGIEVTCH